EGNVTLLDLLQFFQPEEQDRFLREAARRVGAGGRLIIRTGLCDDSRRFRITRGADCLARAVFWMKSGPIHYPTRDSLRDSLEGEGMTGDFQPLWGKTPFNNFLTVWTR
ncbi:MAG: SAM-dependent methyltransferase, partial [Verrucomicrobiota bacterium]